MHVLGGRRGGDSLLRQVGTPSRQQGGHCTSLQKDCTLNVTSQSSCCSTFKCVHACVRACVRDVSN